MRAVAILSSVVVFLALVGVSMACYPGGNTIDPTAPGHDFARNFLCDLLQPRAENGLDNPVGRVATPAALVALATGVALFWSLVPALFVGPRALGAAVRGSGLLSMAGLVAVAFTPAVVAGRWHAAAIFVAAIPALAACIGATWGLARSGRPRLAAAGAAALVLGAIDGVLYARYLARGGPPPLLLPLLQRIATMIFIAWLVAVTLAWLRGSSSRTGARSPST